MSTDNKRPADPIRHGFPPLPPGSSDPLDVPHAPARAIPVASHDSDVPDLDAENSQPGVKAPTADPREIAKKLAEEARQRVASQRPSEIPAAPAPAPAPGPAKKSSLADRAPRRSDPVAVSVVPIAAPEPAPEPIRPAPRPQAAAAPTAPAEPQKKKSLADRAGKRMSMEDALKAAANEPERAPEPVRQPQPQQRAATPAPAPSIPAAPAPVAAAAKPTVAAEAVVAKVFSGCEVRRAVVVSNPVVFRALWTAHRARAGSTGDVALLVAAAALLDAVDRVPAGCLSGVHLAFRGEEITAWVDTARGAVISATPQPELYLAGL